MDHPLILQLDASGSPQKWINWQDAIIYQAKDLVAWSLGEVEFTFYGGKSRMTGETSTITTASIIAVKGHGNKKYKIPAINNRTLFRRDKHICAYCGQTHSFDGLSRDHIQPVSKGGQDIWTNIVTSCLRCNHHKADRTPEQAGMELLYVPYIPTRFETMILQNRKILADQHEFLMANVPKNSRLWD